MTGDAMEQIAEDTFVWIDRVKNILKLSQVRTLLCYDSDFFSAHACMIWQICGLPLYCKRSTHFGMGTPQKGILSKIYRTNTNQPSTVPGLGSRQVRVAPRAYDLQRDFKT
jgi:hypothetical protein